MPVATQAVIRFLLGSILVAVHSPISANLRKSKLCKLRFSFARAFSQSITYHIPFAKHILQGYRRINRLLNLMQRKGELSPFTFNLIGIPSGSPRGKYCLRNQSTSLSISRQITCRKARLWNLHRHI